MSALTLIAFLFFLNILQNCLKDQMKEEKTAEIIMATPAMVQSRDPNDLPIDNEPNILQKRKLLSISDEENDGKSKRNPKFIHDFGIGAENWKNELSQVTDEDLDGQKKKLEQLRKLWDSRRAGEEKKDKKVTNVFNKKRKDNLEEELKLVKVKKFVNNPVLADLRGIPKLSQYWAAQTTDKPEPIEPKYVEFEKPQKRVADFHEFETFATPELSQVENSIVQKTAERLQYQAVDETFRPSPEVRPVFKPVQAVGQIEEVSDPNSLIDALNTPRYRRSDEQLTTLANEQLFQPELNEITEEPSTTKTYHVYTHPHQIWWTTTMPTPVTTRTTTTTTTASTQQDKIDVNSIYLTTSKPMRGPTRYHNHRPHYRPATRYNYNPNRRVSHEPPLVRAEYYPMSVVGQYGGDEDGTAVGVLNLIWQLVTSFAKPIARLVPAASKVRADAQCLDLLACEAHRMGQFMGPAAQALATSFSSLISWMVPETEKPSLYAALAAARENTCQEQIKMCDDRSGGQSTMTRIANLMELRFERKAKLPKTK